LDRQVLSTDFVSTSV